MKKNIIKISTLLLVLGLVTGCGCSKKEKTTTPSNDNTPNTSANQSVIKDQHFEGFEFVNAGASNGKIITVAVNNTGYVFEGSKFSMKIMDGEGKVVVELTDEVKGPMETGTTKTIETKTGADLSRAKSIEYSFIK